MKNSKFKFIPDKEQYLDDLDLLGTRIYVDTITDLIISKQDDDPFTIGLFGGWGSGKSSIVKTVEKRLSEFQSIKVMYYNAWKFSTDTFRRSFILELINKLGLRPENLIQSFYHDISEDISDKVVAKKGSWKNFLIVAPLLFSLVWLSSVTTDTKIFTTLFSVTLSILLFLLKESFISYKTTLIRSKLFAPEQFEEIFKETIDELTSAKRCSLKWIREFLDKDKKVKKVVIIIDNIDRCHKELAKELMLTVKNFFEHKKCIFVIPIDDLAIKKHLEFEENEGEEFLRKFFNVSLRIRQFSQQDLYEFTNSLIEKYELSFSRKIASLVSQEFSKNPRRIIQFLNNLHSEQLIVANQENCDLIEKGAVTNNLEFLAKVLLVKEEWPDLYHRLNFNTNLAKEIDENIRDGKYEKENGNFVINGKLNLTLSAEQYRFFSRTRTFTAKNIEPLLRIKDYYRGIPDDLIEFINSQDWDSIRKLLENKTIAIQQLWTILFRRLDDAINKRQLLDPDGFNLISLVFGIIDDPEYENEFENIYMDMEPFICHRDIIGLIDKFNPKNLITYSIKLSGKGKFYLERFISENINSREEIHEDLMKEFIKGYSDRESLLSEVKDTFSNFIGQDLSRLDPYWDLLKEKKIARALINKELIDKIISKINDKAPNIEEIKIEVEFVKSLNRIDSLTESEKNNFSSIVISHLDTNNYDFMNFWFKAIEEFISSLDENNLSDLGEKLKPRFNFLNQQLNQPGQKSEQIIDCNKNFIAVLKHYYCAIEDTDDQSIGFLNNYLNSNKNKELYFEANQAFKYMASRFNAFNWPFADNVINRFNSVTDYEGKKEIASTIILMLDKTTTTNGEYKGLNESQIETSIDQFFNQLLQNEGEERTDAEEWILHLVSNAIINPVIINKIRSVDDLEEQKVIINLADRIEDKNIVNKIIESILANSFEDDAEFSANLKLIKKKVKEPSSYIKNSLIRILDSVASESEQIDQYKRIIKTSVDEQEIFTMHDIGKIIDKIKPLLASGQKSQESFALKQLDRLDRIPKNKYTLIKALIKEIKSEDKGIQKRIKEKLK